jgi:Protein of unknown function (DUF1573)
VRFKGSILSVICLFALTGCIHSSSYRLSFVDEKAKYDFGDIVEQSSVKHAFQIRNPFKFPIRIAQINRSCGCTQAKFQNSTISPGDDGILEVTLTPDLVGNIRSLVYVTWIGQNTPPSRGTTQIWLFANVKTVAEFSPEIVDLGTISRLAKLIPISVEIKKGTSQITWDRVHLEANLVKLTKSDLSQDESEIKGSIDPRVVTSSAFRDEIKVTLIRNGIPLAVSYSIPVFGKVETSIIANPPLLYLGQVRKPETKQGMFRLFNRDHSKLQFLSVNNSLANGLSVHLIESKGNQFTFQYTINSKLIPQSGIVSGSVMFEFLSLKKESFSMRFLGYIEP